MKTIGRKDFIEIGSVVKAHGTKGELKVVLNREINFKEWAFLEIREKPVPFYIKSCKHLFEEEAFIKFEGVNDLETASKLVGYNLLAPARGLKKAAPGLLDKSILKYELIDSKFGEIGIVEDVLEMPMQILIKTTFNGQELLIPAVEPIIQEINDKLQKIYLDLPEGLLKI
ncbi:MAG: ribosome maturation factor RimM [Bacteroidota bacterium]|nr:ribosome maturation factor RimM [Bacteroidota bacterium]